MLDFLLKIDLSLFYLITETLKNSVFDFIMPLISNSKIWIAPIIILWFSLVIFGRKKGLVVAIICLLAVLVSDFICGNILKHLFNRTRPLGGTTLSFPSCHASNVFTAGTVILYFYKNLNLKVIIASIVLLISYSRIYTASHYPSDVFAGAVLGILFALFFIYLNKLTQKDKFNLFIKSLLNRIKIHGKNIQ